MKRIADLDSKIAHMGGEEDTDDKMPTRRTLLRMIGNIKADTADDARRTRRIIEKLRDKKATDLLIETDDLNFLLKIFEKNPMNWPAWMQGQVLDLIDNADKVEPLEVK